MSFPDRAAVAEYAANVVRQVPGVQRCIGWCTCCSMSMCLLMNTCSCWAPGAGRNWRQPFQTEAPARVGGATVTFEPGARAAWHTHPLRQTLIVIAGAGFVQRWEGEAEPIRVGDIVWIPPGIKHWHGAGPETAMTHIAKAP